MKNNISILFILIAVFILSCHKQNSTDTDTPSNGGTTDNESPDFVTFTDRIFPKGWKTYTWEVDNKVGYDDNFSLRAANYPTALVFANKTMKTRGYVEFYSSGYQIDFFIDDVKAKAISSVKEGIWEKRVYALDTGRHQLKWETEGVNKYIDAIRFYSSE